MRSTPVLYECECEYVWVCEYVYVCVCVCVYGAECGGEYVS
ncbi:MULTISPECIES: hypothetical protein [unclassified Streptomyces]|nr:hypothetical protein [Streptomyces sp. TSRI0281]